jgi:hypothetical protein
MINNLLRKLQTFSTLKTLVVLFTLILIFIGAFIISPTSPSNQLSQNSNGVGMLDAQFHYTAEKAYQMLTAYGAQGRELYLSRILPLDVLIPIVYSLFLAVAISFVFQRAFPPTGPIQYISLLPFAAAIADYIENVGVVSLLLVYPTHLDVVAAITSYFTSSKQIFFNISVVFLLIGILALFWKRVSPTRWAN